MSLAEQGIAVAALASIAYALGAVPTVTAIDAPRQALEAADSLLGSSAEIAGAVEGFWPFLADDALLLLPGLDVLRGRDGIRSTFVARRGGTPGTMKLHRVASGRSEDGGLGYTFGWVEQLSKGAPPEHSKYLAIWRTEGGRWRIQAFAQTIVGDAPSPAPDGNPVVAGYHGVVAPGDPVRLAAEVAQADSAFAALATAETTCAAFTGFADRHAVVFGRTGFRWGIDAVRSAHSACTPADRATWSPIASAAAASGDLGYSVGQAILTVESPSTAASADTDPRPKPSYTKYLTVWTRQADGSWKWLLDAGNPRPAPQPVSRDITPDPGGSHAER